MSDHANDDGRRGDDFTWRFRRSEDETAVGLGGRVVVELVDSNCSALASVSIPPETMDQLLRPHLSIFAELQLDGSVSLDTEFLALSSPRTKPDILDLVSQALAPEMLRDEPDLKGQLCELRRKLTGAISLVDQTLSNLDKQRP